tara:strand:+ start:5814 stop:6578 length:765 start_codon:yes stop_codon:yes gene_type:complete
MSAVGYVRVSTKKQGQIIQGTDESEIVGASIKAQKDQIEKFVTGENRPIHHIYVEVESGRKCDRPELEKALNLSRATGSTLVVAKLDRLARDASFLKTLLSGDVDIKICNFPDIPSGATGQLLIGFLAQIAEWEAKYTGEKTSEAMRALVPHEEAHLKDSPYYNHRWSEKKQTWVKIGGANGNTGDASRLAHAREVRSLGVENKKQLIRGFIEEAQADGIQSLKAQARYLESRGIKTALGKTKWSATQVRRVLA